MSVPVVPTRCQCVRRCMSVSPVDPISWDLPSLWSLNTLQYKSLSHTLFVWVCAPLIIPSDNVEYSDRAQCSKVEIVLAYKENTAVCPNMGSWIQVS